MNMMNNCPHCEGKMEIFEKDAYFYTTFPKVFDVKCKNCGNTANLFFRANNYKEIDDVKDDLINYWNEVKTDE